MARPRTGSLIRTVKGYSARLTIDLHTSAGIVKMDASFDLDMPSRAGAELAKQRLNEQYVAGVTLTDEEPFRGVLRELAAAYSDLASAKEGEDKKQIAKMQKRLTLAQAAVADQLDKPRHKDLKASLFSEGRREAKLLPTFSEAMERVVVEQGNEGFATWEDRRSRLRRYACPEIGDTRIDNVKVGEIRLLLRTDLVVKNLSKTSVGHLRNDLRAVFGQLREEGLIPTNPAEGMKLPGNLKEDGRPRIVLTDDEFQQFMACAAVPEIMALKAASSRMFGGMRTSDIHAWDWSHFDLQSWAVAKVHRPKTEKKGNRVVTFTELVTLVIPEPLRTMLYSYWHEQGQPTTGPVFPVLKGERKGQRQGKRSHVRELREALWTAGIHHPKDGFDDAVAALGEAERALAEARDAQAKGAIRELQHARAAAEEFAKSKDEIQAGGPMFKRADFHSFRRGFATALGAAPINEQQAMALGGWKDSRTFAKYVKLAQRGALETPAAALPTVLVSPLLKPGGPQPPAVVLVPKTPPVGVSASSTQKPFG